MRGDPPVSNARPVKRCASMARTGDVRVRVRKDRHPVERIPQQIAQDVPRPPEHLARLRKLSLDDAEALIGHAGIDADLFVRLGVDAEDWVSHMVNEPLARGEAGGHRQGGSASMSGASAMFLPSPLRPDG